MKGFTLIELLAVIVILAIILLVVMPIVLNLINDSRKGAFESTAYGIVKAAENDCMIRTLANNNYQKIIEISDGQMGSERLDLSGQLPESGFVNINSSCEVAMAVYDGAYCVTKSHSEKMISVVEADKEECVLPVQYMYAGCGFNANDNDQVVYNATEIVTTNALFGEGKLEIVNVDWPNGLFVGGDELTISVDINVLQQSNYRISLRYLDSTDNWVMIDFDEMNLATGNHTYDYSWEIDETFERGYYGAAVQIMEMAGDWTVNRRDILRSAYVSDVSLTDWHYYDENEVYKATGMVGGGVLDPNNVTFDGQSVNVLLPESLTTGGQFYGNLNSKTYTYGTYETRMKIPDNNASLSSFFLYTPETVDDRWEVDIEFYNTSLWGTDKWMVDFTIFNSTHSNYDYYHDIVLNKNEDAMDGVVYYHQAELPAGFDPTINFNNYKINFHMNCISFEVNGTTYGYWDDSFNFSTANPMYIMGGSFYPSWLGQAPAIENTNYELEWLRYRISD